MPSLPIPNQQKSSNIIEVHKYLIRTVFIITFNWLGSSISHRHWKLYSCSLYFKVKNRNLLLHENAPEVWNNISSSKVQKFNYSTAAHNWLLPHNTILKKPPSHLQ